jgi:hypothetical protein
MAQPHSLMARWRRAYWRRCGEQCLLKTLWPHAYKIGAELRHHDLRYRITRYDVAADQRMFEIWGKPVGRAVEPALRLQPGTHRRA